MSMFSACFGSKDSDDNDNNKASNNNNNKGNAKPAQQQQHEDEEEPDDLAKQEMRIKQAKEVFKEHVKDLDKIFKNHHELIECKLKPVTIDSDEDHGVFGPSQSGESQRVEGVMYAKSTSSYPKKPRKEGDPPAGNERLGDPICDCYGFEPLDTMSVASLADGCNWGPKPHEASNTACRSFHAHIRTHSHKFTTIRETGRQLLKAFSQAHTNILKAPLSRGIHDIWETGTTTLLGGVLVLLADEDVAQYKTPYVFLCASVGDCKAFRCSAIDGTVTDITVGTRTPSAITNVNDPGGRLGPYVGKEGSADLRNLSLFILPCVKDDLLLLLSDGVYDNLDPQQLGIPTAEVGLSAETWEQADAKEADQAKDLYRTRLIAEKWKQIRAMDVEQEDESEGEADGEEGAGKKKKHKGKSHKKGSSADAGESDAELARLTDQLLTHALGVTKYSRKWMQQHPTARMPDARSKKKDPLMLGKMDHTTCLAIHVGAVPRSHD